MECLYYASVALENWEDEKPSSPYQLAIKNKKIKNKNQTNRLRLSSGLRNPI